VGGFALSFTAGPSIASPPALADDCNAGESIDVYSLACVPDIAPNTAGAPSEQALTACSGRDQGQCLENQYYGPGTVTVPHVSTDVQQSP
jgi:hypothetical protein